MFPLRTPLARVWRSSAIWDSSSEGKMQTRRFDRWRNNDRRCLSDAAFGTQPVVAVQDAAGNMTTGTNSVTLTITATGGATLTCTATGGG